ncbi:hypothetical protein ACQP1G_10265 [Nocardia sp. CA-107356]|uniref:hypothetical protein n=1 Tax=Nocardia sp. CA-107356 TaxID=3239972 RepID=UPI003D8F514C
MERNIRATIRANGIEHPTQTASITNSVVIIMASGELRAGGPVPSNVPRSALGESPNAEQRNIYEMQSIVEPGM